MQTVTPISLSGSRVGAARFPAGIVFLVILGVTLTGYAFLGRGFAYLGVHPVFVGEVVLMLGLLTWAFTGGTRVFRSWISCFLVVLMGIGAIGTVGWIGTYGFDALRDGVLWGYGLFALIVGTFLPRGGNRILAVVRAYSKWLPWFLVWVPIAMTLYTGWVHLIPRWPGSDVPVLNPKGGDIAVHLSGAMAFLALGLYRMKGIRKATTPGRLEWVMWSLWAVACVTILTGRAVLLTLVSTALLLLIIRPTKHWIKIIVIAVLGATMAIVMEAEFNPADKERRVSPQALVQTFQSIFGETGASYFDGSRRWRLEWWSDIRDYTFFGDYFWWGKGYGVNLADEDGYQVYKAEHGQAVLRSPHNSHLTFLARSGVPGFVIWVALQGMFGLTLFGAYLRARRLGQEDLAKLNLWVLAYWFAFIVNASFDVFLEGPQGGVWFWSLFGFGIAILIVQKRQTNLMGEFG